VSIILTYFFARLNFFYFILFFYIFFIYIFIFFFIFFFFFFFFISKHSLDLIDSSKVFNFQSLHSLTMPHPSFHLLILPTTLQFRQLVAHFLSPFMFFSFTHWNLFFLLCLMFLIGLCWCFDGCILAWKGFC